MIIISNSNKEGGKMAKKLKGRFFYLENKKYPDGEGKLTVGRKIKRADIIYFKFDKNINFDEQLFNLFCVLNQFGDKNTTKLVLPYLPYLRSYPTSNEEIDKLSFIIDVFNKHVKNLYLVYPHNIDKIIQKKRLKNVICIDIDNKIITFLKSIGKDVMLASPDSGFSDNIKRLSKKSGFDYISLSKERMSSTKVILRCDDNGNKKIMLNKNKKFVLIDDIVSTGATMIKAGAYIKSKGVKNLKYISVHNVIQKSLKINIISSNSLSKIKSKTFDITDNICSYFLGSCFNE